MRIRPLLLAGVALGVFAAVGAASAAEVTPGGGLDITLSGQFRTGVVFGGSELINGATDPGYGFYTNNRLFMDVRGKDDDSLTEYGGRIRFRLDNDRGNADNVSFNPINGLRTEGATSLIDRSWLFVRGDWGEIRFGNEVGPADEMKVGSYTIAAGTAGIDGDFNPATRNRVYTYTAPLSGAATKIVYYTPEVAGFQAGVSFAPDDNAAGLLFQNNDSELGGEQHLEAGISYAGGFSGFDILASVTASAAKVNIAGATPGSIIKGQDINGVMGGVSVGFAGFSVAGAYGTNGGDIADIDYWNIGIAGALGPTKLSLEYSTGSGDAIVGGVATDDTDPTAIVASATVGLMPGLSLMTNVGLYDPDVPRYDASFAGLMAIDVKF